MTCASIYKDVGSFPPFLFLLITLVFQIGFLRKNGFFSRLAVLFRLHSDNPEEVRTESDYRVVYPVLYKTLPGYGIHDSVRNAPLNGPVAIQFKALHEVFMSALRAGQYDAAIRHLCYILQVRASCTCSSHEVVPGPSIWEIGEFSFRPESSGQKIHGHTEAKVDNYDPHTTVQSTVFNPKLSSSDLLRHIGHADFASADRGACKTGRRPTANAQPVPAHFPGPMWHHPSAAANDSLPGAQVSTQALSCHELL